MISEAFAMAGQAAPGGAGNPMQPLILMGLMFAVFYFLLIRPQQKRAKTHRDMVNALTSGDQVVTAGGIHGKIVAVQDDVITLEVAAGIKIKFNRSAIATKS
jgi:preprotein translocase subunit YajC